MSATAASPTRTLSESASKELLGRFGVPFPDEEVVGTPAGAIDAASRIGYPVVVKLCGDQIAHKTERGLVRLALGDAAAVEQAAQDLLDAAQPDDGEVALLVAPMVKGNRELIAGVAHDPQFGPTVMIGVGGILAEAVADVAIRLVPIGRVDAEDMLEDLSTQALLGPFRGEPAVERKELVELLLALSAAAQAHPEMVSADCNPVIIVDGHPLAVDALVEVRS